MPIPTMLTLTATPTFPGDPAEATPTLTDMTDDSQVDSDHDGTTKTVLEGVFIGVAVFALIFCLLLRLVCLRRAGRRPIKDFLKPLQTVEHSASPLPSPTTTRSDYARHTITLPSLASQPPAPQMSYAMPGQPISALTTDESGLDAMARHLAGRPGPPRARRTDTLPLYDNKGRLPQYKDIVSSPTPSVASSSSRHEST